MGLSVIDFLIGLNKKDKPESLEMLRLGIIICRRLCLEYFFNVTTPVFLSNFSKVLFCGLEADF